MDQVETVEGYSVKELAREAGISESRLYALIAEGRGPRTVRYEGAPGPRRGAHRARTVIPYADGLEWLRARYGWVPERGVK